ncbi:exoribonuclease [Cavenderia fasciculata]|uniref:Exoribonuclease n=1 Tax=Cavenderia fasciculata TaxID=261658 RepID=F4Q4J2_CACFS|nr:exoribonuclease [Cavenderia fasciculata]EGG17841.1 exoribonuclease [Cavenderia fasciculata]|eukprot:XP_004356325.1 exoribonuclease [Cavenderia fasciculata]
MTTRCMSPALYFSSGSQPYEEYHHYGLACDIYTHFTSPIRRYPDVIVHRLLASSIGVSSVSLNMENKTISNMCDTMNKRHRMAQFAGRGSTTLHTLIFFKNRKTVEQAYIIRVKANAFVVLVPRYGFETTVYVSEPNAPTTFQYDCNSQTLSNGTLTFRVFDQVTVEIYVDETKAHDQKLKTVCVNPKIDFVNAQDDPDSRIKEEEEEEQEEEKKQQNGEKRGTKNKRDENVVAQPSNNAAPKKPSTEKTTTKKQPSTKKIKQ